MNSALKTKCEQGICSNFSGISNRQEHEKPDKDYIDSTLQTKHFMPLSISKHVTHILLVFRFLLINTVKFASL